MYIGYTAKDSGRKFRNRCGTLEKFHGLGQRSNFSRDEPNLVSYFYEKFDIWFS